MSKRPIPVAKTLTRRPEEPADTEVDPDDPDLTRPMPRYNAMLAVLRNTLYM